MSDVSFRASSELAVRALWSFRSLRSSRFVGRPPTVAAMSDHGVAIEIANWSSLTDRVDDWSRLVDAALEPNAFLEPAFAIPAAQHLDSLRETRFLIASTGGAERRMIGLWPIAAPSLGGLARTWMHDYSACGAPLLDRDLAPQALDAFLAGLAARASNAAGIAAPAVPTDGPTAIALHACADRLGLTLRLLAPRDRPILAAEPRAAAAAEQATRERKMNRTLRKLRSAGPIEHRIWDRPADMKDAIEQFLTLEASGWKGKRGTALVQDPRATTFARTMSRMMSRNGKIRIDGLCLDGAPIAMTISLLSGGRCFLWKTAYDEKAAGYSPGAQLIVFMSASLLADPGIESSDSCASNDNPAILRLWSERQRICDLYLSCAADRNALFEAAMAREEFRLTILSGARSAYRAAREPKR